MSKVRIGVIGVGGMGGSHCENAHTLPNTEMAAACDISQEHLDKCTEKYGCEGFTDYNEMLDSGLVDAIAIAVPHFFHGPPAIAALKKKIHVLVEKPVAVHVEDVDEMLAAHTDKSVVFAAMFNQRTGPVYQEARRLVQSGEIGELQRTNLIITDWFRTQAYYNSGGWRGTWKGEGGGVLVNQCPHNLDLFQWICGMPSEIEATCEFGKYHDIEVEDEVSANLTYANGAKGYFYTTTGEYPGTNRMEIIGDKGKIVIEGGKLAFWRNSISASSFINESTAKFGGNISNQKMEYTFSKGGNGHRGIIENFANAILHGEELLSPAIEGRNSVELANAMIYSSVKGEKVKLPLDAKAYTALLEELQANSTANK